MPPLPTQCEPGRTSAIYADRCAVSMAHCMELAPGAHSAQDHLVAMSLGRHWGTLYPHQRDSMPPRGTKTGFSSGPRWTPQGSTNLSARSCTWIDATITTNTSWGMKELSAVLPKKTWRYWWMGSWTWASNVPLQPRKPTVSWAASKEVWPAGWGSDRTLLLCADEASPGVLRPDVESSVQERHGPAGVCPEEGHKNDPRDETRLLWGQAERPGAVRWPGNSLSVSKEELQERRGQTL